MQQRVDYQTQAVGVYKAMRGLESYLHSCGLEEDLIHLVKLRASQLNGCAYCIDMHWKDLRARGETEQRLRLGCLARKPLLHRTRARRAHVDRGRHAHHGRPCVRCRL